MKFIFADFAIGLSVMVIIGLNGPLWLMPIVLMYGLWNYFLGYTSYKL